MFVLGFVFSAQSLFSQTLDSNGVIKADSLVEADAPEKGKDDKVKPYEIYPRKAAFRSAILPGWGQVTNGRKHYYKLPIIYGLLGTAVYFTHFNYQQYAAFKVAYLTASDEDPTTGHVLMRRYPNASTLRTFRDDYRKNRDLMVILTLGAYALNVIDAYVFAHLKSFDMSDDLSLNLSPVIFSNIASQPQAGIALKMRF